MVRGLEILTKQIVIFADFVELANRRWCRTVQTFLEEDSVMKARKSESELQRVRLKRQGSTRPADCHQHRQPVFPGEFNFRARLIKSNQVELRKLSPSG